MCHIWEAKTLPSDTIQRVWPLIMSPDYNYELSPYSKFRKYIRAKNDFSCFIHFDFLPKLVVACLSCFCITPNRGVAKTAQPMAKEQCDFIKILPSSWGEQGKVKDFNQFLQFRQIQPDNIIGKARLSESDAVLIGLSNSPEIRSSIYQYKQADYQLKSAYGAYFPNLEAFNTSANTSYSSTTFNYGGSNWGSTPLQKKDKKSIDKSNTGITSYFQGLLGAQLSINIVDIPRDLSIAAAIENRKYYQKLIGFAVKQKLQSLRLAVLQIQAADQLINAYKQSAKFAKSAYEQILKSYEGGYSTKIDVDNYYALYNSYQANVATSISSRQSAVSQLLSQMSWPQSVDLDIEGAMQQPREWPLTLQESLRFADQNSDQVQALIIQSKIYRIQAKSELANYLPVVSLSAYGFTNNQVGQVYIGDPTGTTSKAFDTAISVNLNWTLFDGLINLNNSRAYQQNRMSYEQQSLTQKFSVEQSVGSYYSSIKANTIAFRLNSKAYQSQQELTGLTLIGYKTGYNTVFDLVNAQQNTINSKISQIQSQQTANSSLIQIQTMTGGYLCSEAVVNYACELLRVFDSQNFINLGDKANG